MAYKLGPVSEALKLVEGLAAVMLAALGGLFISYLRTRRSK